MSYKTKSVASTAPQDEFTSNKKILSQISILEAKKNSLFEIVQSIYDMSLTISDAKIKPKFIARSKSLDTLRVEFMQVIEQLNELYLSVEDDYLPTFACLSSFDELYSYIKNTESDLSNHNTSDVSQNKKPLSNEFLNRKLPALELMSFDGSPNKWILFYENFKALIHDNPHLSDAEKVQYLIGKLSGRALIVCAGIPPVASNYNILWNALIEKYQDKRTLATSYLEQIINFKPISTASSSTLDMFIEHFVTAEAALQQLEIPNLSDFIILYLALNRLDKHTVSLFEQAHRNDSLPSFKNLVKFVKEQSKIHLLRTPNTSISTNTYSHSHKDNRSQYHTNSKSKQVHSFVVNDVHSVQRSCKLCKSAEIHPLYKCEYFLKQDPIIRADLVKKHNYCKNCLGFHDLKYCKSQSRCFICNLRHHTKLHINNFNNNIRAKKQSSVFIASSASNDTTATSRKARENGAHMSIPLACTSDADGPAHSSVADSRTQLTSCSDRAHITSLVSNNKQSVVLLPTALVYVYDNNGKRHQLRVLIDSGSMSHFITKSCCERLHLNINHAASTVQGIGCSEKITLGQTQFTIQSRLDSRYKYSISARVIDAISNYIPSTYIDTTDLNHLKDIPLADDQYYVPTDIDCLISNELFPFLLLSNKIVSPRSSVVAMQTTLGYVLMGKADCSIQHPQNYLSLCSLVKPCLELITQKFWELESVPSHKIVSPDEDACERIFTATYKRDVSGRYVVSLPFKKDFSALGNSYAIAMRRYLNLERKLNSNAELRTGYNTTIQEYIDNGYLSKVEDPSTSPAYYIPHHAVYKPEKSSSKIRIVLDASCKTTSNNSLNDMLYIGPNLQNNIFNLLLNLRIYPIALSADIEKMYFQIKLKNEHHPFQRILFRFNSDDKMSTFQFNRVSFGISSSPYLAMRVIKQLAEDERAHYPAAAYAAERHLYMDDYISSVESVQAAKDLFNEMTSLFNAGGFKLGKWISNSSQLLNHIPSELRSTHVINFDDSSTKVVGLMWKPSNDTFLFTINADNLKCTKRNILSAAARLFDPLGLVSPVVAFMKLLVQECWKRNLDWDDDPPLYISDQWHAFQTELPHLSSIKIPRHIGITLNSYVTLIGFADASERCYGAVVYVKVCSSKDEQGSVTLLCSKSRLAPLKTISLARLELCAALLLANLMYSVRDTLSERCVINEMYAFSDSTVALAWIHSPPYRFQTFIANRITEINSKLSSEHWYHVSGNMNPADIVSRPVTPGVLLLKPLWFQGPPWVSLPKSRWPIKENIEFNIELPETKTVSLNTECTDIIENNIFYDLASRISKWVKLLRVTVYVLRFIKHLKFQSSNISVQELELAEKYLVRVIQNKHYKMEIVALTNNKRCNAPLQTLNPFLDNNIIRVGGRLQNSQLEFHAKHPYVLPSKDIIVNLIVDYYHTTNLHAGPALLLSLIRQKFWIISARNMIRKYVQRCNICYKNNPKVNFPIMGNLPEFRVNQVKSFVHTGVDYIGPFFVSHLRRRGIKSQKAYICLFICLTTKALHLELVTDLTSDLFLAAFKRFISRRGPVSVIVSDGGTNFLGAKHKINELYSLLTAETHNKYLTRQLADLRIQFKTNPPYGPHFGGIWESNVKSVKTHLFKVIGTQILTYEELNTILVQIEGLLNSRPLCVLSSDPSELTALTPAHFLNITPVQYLPVEDLVDVPDNRL